MTEPLNLTHLRSLVAAVDRRSFTRAAQMLHLSQSTVSQHIRLLERRVGTELFVRGQHGVTLTARGVQFADKARLLLAEHDDLLHDFAGTGPGYRRPLLAVGSTEHAADQLLPKLLTAFGLTFPGHEMSFTLQRSTALVDAVQRGDLDLAVILAVNADAPGTRVGAMRLRWAAGADTILPDRRQAVALVAFEDPCAIRARAVDLLAGAGVTVHVAAQAATLDGVLAATRAGLGIALLPTAAGLPAGLRELDGLPDPGDIAVHLVSREGVPDAVTHTARGMLTAFLEDATDPDSPAPPSRKPAWRRIG